jgi:hypothetical protein
MLPNLAGACAEVSALTLLRLLAQHVTRCVAATAAAAAAGPTMEVAAINKAIGAESAFSMQCKTMVQQYVPQIIKMITQMPLDQVGCCTSVLLLC